MKQMMKTMLLIVGMTCLFCAKISAIAYVGYDPEAKVLIFFASDDKYVPGSTFRGYVLKRLWSGAKVEYSGESTTSWYAFSHRDTEVVIIDESFKDVRPYRCAAWFQGYMKLKKIVGLEYLNTSECVAFDRMFDGCPLLTTLDLSTFDTSKAQICMMMFQSCSNLKTIYVSEKWNTKDKVTYPHLSNFMFRGCNKLVGGDGTVYTDALENKRCDYVGEGGLLTLKK